MPLAKQFRSQAQRAHLERIRSAQLKSQEDGEDTLSDEEVTATSSHSRRLTRAAALKELDILHETVSKYCTDLESYKQALVQRETEICDLRDALQSTQSQYAKLQDIVSQLRREHAISQKALVTVERALAKEQHKHVTYYKELCNERRKSLRARSSARRQSDQAKELQEVIIPTANTKAESTIQQLQARVVMLEGHVISLEAERAQLRNKLSESRKKTRCFQMQALRAKKSIGRSCNKASELARTQEFSFNILIIIDPSDSEVRTCAKPIVTVLLIS
ncbi:hypothetical protein F4604DRAFT_1723627 [Suillus subluteus]|nr:hypothetical protein F4604DRAFT_1723627 [Suillus subluteus]